tara:strand:- start:111 stop:239 length:129 start_codon:yes stop_codon:yes gene_type:complete
MTSILDLLQVSILFEKYDRRNTVEEIRDNAEDEIDSVIYGDR